MKYQCSFSREGGLGDVCVKRATSTKIAGVVGAVQYLFCRIFVGGWGGGNLERDVGDRVIEWLSLSFVLDCDFSVEIAQLNMSISTGRRISFLSLQPTSMNLLLTTYIMYCEGKE